MDYHSSSEYETNSAYSSNSNKHRYRLTGLCRGTCQTGRGCSCR